MQKNRAILLLAFAAFFSGAALRVCDSLIPRLARDFSITAGTAGRVIISFSVAYGLMQLLFGPLGDRYGKARMIGLALFACAAASFACALAPGFDSLVALRIVWGMGAAGVIPLSMALIGDMVPYEERQATLARLLTGILSGMMAGQLAGGLFADSAPGWRGAFAVLGVGYSVVAVLLALNMRAHDAHAQRSTQLAFVRQMSSVLAVPWARVILVSVALEGVFLLGPIAYLPAYLHERFALSLAAASGLVALYAVGGLFYAMAARRLVRDWGERRMVLAGGLLMGASFLALWLSPWWLTAGPAALVLGFGTYLYHNTLQTHATQMAPEVRGTSVAAFAFCLFAGQALGVSLAGAVLDGLGFALLLAVPGIVLPVAGAWLARALAARALAA
ncbi:MFS transporter [Ramlibacter sp. PS4R-6]|uniref:MFS transporter n=1 Tax=Ramlibacter sp. PS4R-6 TaxID=3133438 RepID=UPI0030A0BF0C